MKKYEAPVVDIDIFAVGDVMAAYGCEFYNPNCPNETMPS